MTPRLLITGATGLLGSCFLREAPADKASAGVLWTPLGVSRTVERGNCLSLDITSRNDWLACVREQRITHIVNCAANRNPDACREDPVGAYAANAGLPSLLAEVSRLTGVRLVQISTDYVFDGEAAPYAENAQPCPCNVYGHSKRAGELAVLSAPQSLVVRIPALFRMDVDDVRNVVRVFAEKLRQGERFVMDAETVRYYTLADDVARAVCHAITVGAEGVLHLTSSQRTSKAGLARAVARHLGLPESLVVDGPVDVSAEKRPLDSHLDASLYASMNGPHLRGVVDCFS